MNAHRETFLEGGDGYTPYETEENEIIMKIIDHKRDWIAENFEDLKKIWESIIDGIDKTSWPAVNDCRKNFSDKTGVSFGDVKAESKRRTEQGGGKENKN